MAKDYFTSGPSVASLSNRTRHILFACAAITLLLFFLPFGRTIGYPLILISTLVHELGHGVTALIAGCEFRQLNMWSDGSGVATIIGQNSSFTTAFIAAGGLVGPPIAAALSFLAAKRPSIARIYLTLLGVGLIAVEFLYVRNLFAWIFVGILAGIFLWLAQQSRPWLAQAALVFCAIQLSLSVFSRMDYLFSDRAVTAQGISQSDVAAIAEALILPYWFWGAVCALFSITVLAFGLWSYVRK